MAPRVRKDGRERSDRTSCETPSVLSYESGNAKTSALAWAVTAQFTTA